MGKSLFVAMLAGKVLGLAGGIDSGAQGIAELVSMWVDPGSRRLGVGGLLVAAVVDWASSAGYDQVRLWVVEGNFAAERLYGRVGFRKTGAVQPVREGDERLEFEMSLSLPTRMP